MYYGGKEQGQCKALSGVGPELSFLEKVKFSKIQESGEDMLRLWKGMRERLSIYVTYLRESIGIQ